ncbi:GerAB/ArcD/ProY family transporter [Bacillus sp. 165]|uniref:GerAB/ArcD/ProY family transporter n=1 Tax=Bacillus sp. 165 TaxID=1529117 RepID=UPI001ADB37B1|nr:GerAB/ArcD/ProY family transporter [Bacillus sp. 165]MBO9129338.1 GerAB/ArcD/ProY family transporter [Bacillus sp. 165]
MNEFKTIPKHLMFPSSLLFFVITTLQVGVGITNFPRILFIDTGQDSWISVILAGLLTHITLFIIVRILSRYDQQDLYDIHKILFGKKISVIVNGCIIVYLISSALSILLGYFEIIRAFLFEDAPMWLVITVMITLTIYAVFGGIRVIVGVAFVSFLLTTWLLPVMVQSIEYFDYLHFFPVLEANPKELALGTYHMTFALTGFEILYFFYPYAQDKRKAGIYAQLGALCTNLIYLYVMVLNLGFYSNQQLEKTLWPSLSLFKVIRFPFLEQFEVLIVSLFMLVILPNFTTLFWSASKGMKKLLPVRQKTGIFICAFTIIIAAFFFNTSVQINSYTTWFSKIAFYFIYIYPLFLFLFSIVFEKIRNKKKVTVT